MRTIIRHTTANRLIERTVALGFIYYAGLACFWNAPPLLSGMPYAVHVLPGVILLGFVALATLQSARLPYPAIVIGVVGLTLIGLSIALHGTLVHGGMILALFLIGLVAGRESYGLLELLNLTFLIICAWGGVSILLGLHPWGILPGQDLSSGNPELWWRVGVFPFETPPLSGFIGLLVVVANFLQRGGPARLTTIFLGCYFALLSGSRTVFLTAGAVMVVLLVYRHVSKSRVLTVLLSWAIIGFAWTVQINAGALYGIARSNSIVSSMIFRTQEPLSASELGDFSSKRVILAKQYLDAVDTGSVVTGRGPFQLSQLYEDTPGGTAIPALSIFAKLGVFGALLAAIAVTTLMAYPQISVRIAGVFFLNSFWFYGGYLNVYDVYVFGLCVVALMKR